jgi:hypothetical protein
MVSFIPLDVTDEDSIAMILLHVDHTLQYGEDMEPKGALPLLLLVGCLLCCAIIT